MRKAMTYRWRRWAALQICAWLPSNRKDAIAILKLVHKFLDKER
jgi:hypothetical protein